MKKNKKKIDIERNNCRSTYFGWVGYYMAYLYDS